MFFVYCHGNEDHGKFHELIIVGPFCDYHKIHFKDRVYSSTEHGIKYARQVIDHLPLRFVYLNKENPEFWWNSTGNQSFVETDLSEKDLRSTINVLFEKTYSMTPEVEAECQDSEEQQNNGEDIEACENEGEEVDEGDNEYESSGLDER